MHAYDGAYHVLTANFLGTPKLTRDNKNGNSSNTKPNAQLSCHWKQHTYRVTGNILLFVTQYHIITTLEHHSFSYVCHFCVLSCTEDHVTLA